MSVMRLLIDLTQELQRCATLEAALQHVAERAAQILATPRVSVRLLDPGRTRLMARARAGEPLHTGGMAEFRMGEGLIGWIALHGAAIRAEVAERDPRFAGREGMREPMGAFLGVPLVSGQTCLGVLSAVNPKEGYFTAEHEEQLTVLAGICAPHIEVARLARMAHVDPLTGALNRRGLELAFPDDPGRVTVALGDIDHFKQINDVHGHAAGDRVLTHVASVLAAVVRANDAVVRYGGEEFLLVLPGTEWSVGARVADRARVTVESVPLVFDGRTLAVTISFGVAARRADESRDDVIARADQALYRAKGEGRNRVIMAAEA